MKRFVFPLAVALCFLALVSQHSTVSAKDTWVSVRTKNFFMIGNANEKEVRKVALKLEQFREVFTKLFPNMKFNTPVRSEEHTSELQSQSNLVCRLLLEKKNIASP